MKKQIMLFIAILFAASCSTDGIVPSNYSGSGGREKVVARSGPKPPWAFERPMFFQNGNLYASGMFTDAPNLGKGLEIAAKLAQAKMAESLRLEMEESFDYASSGIELPETQVEHAVRSITGAIVVKGMAHNKYYYEKKAYASGIGSGYRYDCFALVELSYDNYKKAIISGVQKSFGDPKVTEKIIEGIEVRQQKIYGIPEDSLPSEGEADEGIIVKDLNN